MTPLTVEALPVAVLDAHLLSDDAVRRLAAGATSVTSFVTDAAHVDELGPRASGLGVAVEVADGGVVDDIRGAIVECAQRGILVIGAPTPQEADRFVALCLQGAASATEFDVPGVAVHVLRDEPRAGSVAWLTDTGEMSGYGVLFAVAYAALHNTGVDLVEPSGGAARPRTPEAIESALAHAQTLGIPVTRHTDPSPMARVLRDPHCLVVHPVLDAPTGFNLLHPGELPHKAVRSGNPAVVVELLEKFPGDVVAVYDGVHLIGSGVQAARIAATAALGVVGVAGIGIVAAPAAMADSGHHQSHASETTHIPAGHHYGWCKNPNNPHHDSEGCGEMPVGWMGSVVPQGPQGPTTQTPDKNPDPVVVTGTPGEVTEHISDTTAPQRTPTIIPPEYQQTPVPIPQQTPPVTQQAPHLQPQVPTEQKVPTPVPTVVPPVTQQVPHLQPQVPGPDAPTPQGVPTPIITPQEGPMLVPPLRGPVTETSVTPTTTHVETTETPVTETPVEVGGTVVTPGTTDGGAVIPGTGVTTTVGQPPTSTPQHQATTHVSTPAQTGHPHHASAPGHVTTHQSKSTHGELAHTGGNAAILSIVAGSLIAAGAGIAVASRVGKDGDAEAPTEG